MNYQEKIRKTWESTESGRLALGIYDVERADFRTRRYWYHYGITKWELSDNVRLEISEDDLMWYLFKYDDDEDETYFKAVPKMYYDVSEIDKVLSAQHWCCV